MQLHSHAACKSTRYIHRLYLSTPEPIKTSCRQTMLPISNKIIQYTLQTSVADPYQNCALRTRTQSGNQKSKNAGVAIGTLILCWVSCHIITSLTEDEITITYKITLEPKKNSCFPSRRNFRFSQQNSPKIIIRSRNL
jgi:hypothetical protein